jgi:hypothetical protein
VRLLVDGRDLEVVDHRSARLRDLVDLQAGTRRWRPGGLRQQGLEAMARASTVPGFADGPDWELWIGAVVFLSRRSAGDVGSVTALIDCAARFLADPDDVPDGDEALPAEPSTARWAGDVRGSGRVVGGGVTGGVDWPFDDVMASLAEWMAVVSHRWPGITPLTVLDLSAAWWAYYVRAARELRRSEH